MTNSVSITGIKAAGSTLKAKAADTAGVSNVSYVWLDVVTTNTGTTTNVLGTGSSYKLTSADISKNIDVVATYKTTAGIQTSITSTDILDDLNQAHTGGISLKGSTTIGSTLSVVSTIKDKDGLGDFSYEWIRSNADGTGSVTISDATSSKYTLTSADEGKSVRAVVTYVDNHDFNEEVVSALSNKVAYSTTKSSLADHLTVLSPSKAVSGGLGADTFIFNSINTKSFKISDFSTSQGDKLDLSAIDANLTTSGNAAFTFGAKPTSTPADGALWFDSTTSTLYGSVDTDIDPEFSVVLTGVTSLTAADFAAL